MRLARRDWRRLAVLCVAAACGACGAEGVRAMDEHLRVSGVYPHLAVTNSSDECGVGAVADWAGRLWFLTYPPHEPRGSDDRS